MLLVLVLLHRMRRCLLQQVVTHLLQLCQLLLAGLDRRRGAAWLHALRCCRHPLGVWRRWTVKGAADHGAVYQAGPVAVALQGARMPDDDEAAARSREADVDASLVGDKADAAGPPALLERPDARKQDDVLLAALEAVHGVDVHHARAFFAKRLLEAVSQQLHLAFVRRDDPDGRGAPKVWKPVHKLAVYTQHHLSLCLVLDTCAASWAALLAMHIVERKRPEALVHVPRLLGGFRDAVAVQQPTAVEME
mmetsp:Transcript_35685/g.105465  ORF Transcript_35685/g.105465 Transcript_35685/m.105465 type:complete len:250 (-) Transcript_35685:159-908(-)